MTGSESGLLEAREMGSSTVQLPVTLSEVREKDWPWALSPPLPPRASRVDAGDQTAGHTRARPPWTWPGGANASPALARRAASGADAPA